MYFDMHTSVLSVGIDVGKTKLDVACMRQDRSAVHQVFSNDPKGITGLKKFLKQQRTAATVPCTLESTGSYHYLVSLSLREAGYRVNCVNPIITKKYRKATVRDSKSDKTDCMRIAELGANEPNLQPFSLTREDIAAKSVLSALAFHERALQQLEGHVAHFQELEKTVGVKVDQRAVKKAAEYLQKQIDVHRLKLAAEAPQEAREIAANVSGVSLEHVAALLVALKDRQFENRDQLIAFVGLDIKTRQSGSWIGKEVLSKRGNAYLRKILFQTGWGLMLHNEQYRPYYQRMRDRGKAYKTSIIATARKFLRFLFAFFWKKTIAFPSRQESRTSLTLASFENAMVPRLSTP
jgi:transposase